MSRNSLSIENKLERFGSLFWDACEALGRYNDSCLDDQEDPMSNHINQQTTDLSKLCYRIFIVRCWTEQATEDRQQIARFTLDVPATGKRYGFVTREALLDALELVLVQAQRVQTIGEESS
ncbi:hypothetical protein KFU94_68550 [Chloroflexi bacterium TSY]|nr:hypothetical protein [Chloroflexi bacterium TSY]